LELFSDIYKNKRIFYLAYLVFLVYLVYLALVNENQTVLGRFWVGFGYGFLFGLVMVSYNETKPFNQIETLVEILSDFFN
jgi:MFS family permease